MGRVLAVFMSALFLAFGAPAWAEDDPGQKLVEEFLAAAKKNDLAALERILAPGFQAAHTHGIQDRAGELELAGKIKLGAYKLTNFRTTRNGPVMVVTFKLEDPKEVISGRQVYKGAHDRLSVWLKTDAGWRLIAYANMAPLKKK